jgi:hypothetical protein
MDTEIFIEKANNIHNHIYDYSKSIYASNKEHIIITCEKHGDFKQSPNNHLTGYNCMKCSIEQRSNKRKSVDFIQRSKIKFGDNFDYSNVIYINNCTNIELICKIHGIFHSTPASHMNSKTGCTKCSIHKTSESQKLKLNDLITRSNILHKYKYDYSKVKYVNISTKIEILCPEHGTFFQSPKRHLTGSGCSKCVSSKGETKISSILDKNNVQYITQHTFKECKLKRPLKFDFFLINNNIAIEYDGEQHFKPLSIFGGEKVFNLQKIKDQIKNDYCKKNNIILIRIKYDENIDEKINELLNEIKV